MTVGLSGRDSIGSADGMLFVFDEPKLPAFWMKDMRFPLDIIWIAGGRVSDIDENVTVPSGSASDDELPRYIPDTAIDRVLEVEAGFVKKNSIRIGDEFRVLSYAER